MEEEGRASRSQKRREGMRVGRFTAQPHNARIHKLSNMISQLVHSPVLHHSCLGARGQSPTEYITSGRAYCENRTAAIEPKRYMAARGKSKDSKSIRLPVRPEIAQPENQVPDQVGRWPSLPVKAALADEV